MEGKKIKLAIVIPSSIAMGGGVERWALNILNHMNKGIFDVTLYDTDFFDMKRFDDIFIESKLQGVKRIKFQSPDSKFRFMRKNILFSIFLDFLLPVILTLNRTTRLQLSEIKDHYDLVYLTRNSYWRLFKDKTKLIVGSSHAIFSSDSAKNVLFSKLVATGFFLRNIKVIHIYQGREKITKILKQTKDLFELPNPVSVTFNNSQNEGAAKFLFVGRLEKYKGLDLLIESWKKSNVKDSTLTIIGAGSMKELIEDAIKSGIDNIKFSGMVDDKTLFKEYGRSDIFLYPTRWDSLPTTILEALCSGLYILTSESLKPSFKEEYQMKYMDFFKISADDISNKIEQTIDNIQTYRQIRNDISSSSINKYGISSVERRFEKIIMDLVERYN
jgi:glycosyltransferase involved in cell wall biosynthesis